MSASVRRSSSSASPRACSPASDSTAALAAPANSPPTPEPPRSPRVPEEQQNPASEAPRDLLPLGVETVGAAGAAPFTPTIDSRPPTVAARSLISDMSTPSSLLPAAPSPMLPLPLLARDREEPREVAPPPPPPSRPTRAVRAEEAAVEAAALRATSPAAAAAADIAASRTSGWVFETSADASISAGAVSPR